MNIDALRILKCKLLGVRPRPRYLTVKQIREIMRNGDDMPTSIFSTSKDTYIVKARTIFGKAKRRNKRKNIGRISY